MKTLLQILRRLSGQAADLFRQSWPYLMAGDPSRPPPAALWQLAWEPDARRERPARRAARGADQPAPDLAIQPGSPGACACCG